MSKKVHIDFGYFNCFRPTKFVPKKFSNEVDVDASLQ